MQHSHSRRGAVVGALGAVALGLAACSGTSADEGNAEATEFTYWSAWNEGEVQQEVMAQAIEDFTAETGIEVNVQWQGRDNVQRLVPALNTNEVPDLVDQSYVNTYGSLVAAGQVQGLSTAWNADIEGQTLADIVPAQYLEYIDIELDDGEYWMVPYQLTSDAIWFDAATHPDLVDNTPQSWEEFVALLDDLQADGHTPIALDGDIPGYNVYWFKTLLLRELGPGALYELASDETGAAWDDPAVLEAAQKVQQLVDGDYFIDGFQGSQFPEQQQQWASGNAALLFMGSWAAAETEPYAADGFEYSSFPFPPGTHDSARVDFTGFVVPSTADHAEAAQEFAAFFLREEYQTMLGEGAGLLPVRQDVDVNPVLDTVMERLATADSFHQQNDGVAFPGYNDTVFWAINDDLVLGNLTAEEFVEEAKEATISYWEDQA
ncbi:ABC transporter substrate-binding protein [Pseudactinotalea sp. Z1739]|uniref:ABC transporter substrate-binding protein n=1 Tax=Pseudactinotalea sp. Z1739 TaxID=3413028 RepID=UPI003C7E95D3